MLIVEDGYRFAIFPEDLGDLFEELIPRVFRLAELAFWVVAMLANDQHGIYRERIAATTQCLGDARKDRKPEFCRPLATQVVFGKLIDVCRDDVERRVVPAAIDRIAHQEALGHMPCV